MLPIERDAGAGVPRARFIVTRLATRARSSSAENGFVT